MIWIELFSTYLHPLIRVLIVKPSGLGLQERRNNENPASVFQSISLTIFVLTYLAAGGLRPYRRADPPYGPTLAAVIVLAFAEVGPVWQTVAQGTKWRVRWYCTWSPRIVLAIACLPHS
jgi:hypothetical protein